VINFKLLFIQMSCLECKSTALQFDP